MKNNKKNISNMNVDELSNIVKEAQRNSLGEYEGRFQVINNKLDTILSQVTKTNSRVDKLEDRTNVNEKAILSHSIQCPNEPRIRKVEDNQLTSKSINGFIAKTVSVTTVIITIIVSLINHLLG